MSLPAVLNEVISVTGVISFPYDQNATSTPVDQVDGVIPNPLGPILLFGNSLTIGGTSSASSTTGGTGGGGTTATGFNANAQLLAAGDFTLYANRIAAGVNRSDTTDFAAPAFNVPTFRRTFTVPTGTTSTTAGSPTDHLTFTQVGTSMSASIVTGAYALVSSALNYWTALATSNGYTADAYLNSPVGVDSLTFGRHAFKNLSAWNTPSGINGILAWTAVPATDANDGGSLSTPPMLPLNNTTFRSYASINVANSIAAIEGYVAINYLFAHHDWQYIDTNHDGLVTASEVQTFVDNSAAMGLPEAGAMAALLGGTATYSAVEPGINNTVFNENPDDPAAEQRRFNFFDYAADGQLNGSITMNELKMLSRVLLPAPDAYAITDRQRASANGFLLDPTAQRNTVALQHILPQFAWVPKSAVKKYRNISPSKFGVDKGVQPGFTFPLYTLFNPAANQPPSTQSAPQTTVVAAARSTMIDGVSVTVDWLSNVPATSTSSSAATTSTTSAPSTLTPAGTLTPTSAASTPAGTASPTVSTPAPATVLGPVQANPDIAVANPSSSSTTSGTTTAPVTAPTTASSTTSSSAAATAAAATPPPEAAAPRKKVVATKPKSKNSISSFFSDIGKSLKKTFG